MSFPYKTVLITGATSGIGLALAERMIEAGIFVIAVGRRQDRLDELASKHGRDKIATEAFDVSQLDALPAWASRMTSTYPSLDCIFLNAGFQRSVNFTSGAAEPPSARELSLLTEEMTTNYLSPLHTLTLFLPHLISLAPNPAAVVLVSSGLSITPLPRCPNYSATKAALHSLAWSLRCQLQGGDNTKHVRVVEILPPAVKTELHSRQEDLVREGKGDFGVELDEYIDETWKGLTDGEEEIMHSSLRGNLGEVEKERKGKWEAFVRHVRDSGLKF